MRAPRANGTTSEHGQASVEFLGVLPATLLLVLVAWQLALAGHTAWLAANAARVGARASAVGRDAEPAARSALPSYLQRNLDVRSGPGGRVSVQVRLPLVLGRWGGPLPIRASAAMEPG
jgi:pilus assembly protein CpaE